MKAPRSATALSAARAALRAKAARFAIAASVAAFFALEAPAMVLYHGGTGWDAGAPGYSFWDNYLCDLLRREAIDGAPNAVGATLAAAAMISLLAGLVPFWLELPRLLGARSRIAPLARALGLLSVAGVVGVVLLPSDRFGAIHGLAVVVAAVPGLLASFLAVLGLARHEEAPRVAAAVGAAWLGFAAVDFVFYARHLAAGNEGSPLLPAAQKVALVCLMAWMLAVAARLAPTRQSRP
jgi:hypothetical protein